MTNLNSVLKSGAFHVIIFTAPLVSSLMAVYFAVADVLFPGAEIRLHITVVLALVLTAILLPLIALIMDRKTLKWANLFYPHWGWFFITPVYVWKRVVNNGMHIGWFWLYVFLNFGYSEIILSLIPE